MYLQTAGHFRGTQLETIKRHGETENTKHVLGSTTGPGAGAGPGPGLHTVNLGTGVGTVALGEAGLTRRRGLRAAVTLLFLHYWPFCTAECVLRLDGLCHSFQPFLKSRTSRFFYWLG